MKAAGERSLELWLLSFGFLEILEFVRGPSTMTHSLDKLKSRDTKGLYSRSQVYLIAQPRFETWVYLLNFLSTDLLTHTNLKEPLQKGTETRWMSHWISMSKGKYYSANSEITPLFRESGWQYNIQQAWKKDKHQVPLIPPSLSLFPRSDTLKQDQGVCHGHWPIRTQAGCRQEQWCKLDQNELGLGVIFANYPFSPLNFSYTFSHQLLTILLEPMPLPVHFQLNDICPWQWTSYYLASAGVSPFPRNCSLSPISNTFQT